MKTNHIDKNLKKITWDLGVPNSLKIGPIQSYLLFFNLDQSHDDALRRKGLVKLIKRVKIARSFLQSVSDQFHIIILSLPM